MQDADQGVAAIARTLSALRPLLAGPQTNLAQPTAAEQRAVLVPPAPSVLDRLRGWWSPPGTLSAPRLPDVPATVLVVSRAPLPRLMAGVALTERGTVVVVERPDVVEQVRGRGTLAPATAFSPQEVAAIGTGIEVQERLVIGGGGDPLSTQEIRESVVRVARVAPLTLERLFGIGGTPPTLCDALIPVLEASLLQALASMSVSAAERQALSMQVLKPLLLSADPATRLAATTWMGDRAATPDAPGSARGARRARGPRRL